MKGLIEKQFESRNLRILKKENDEVWFVAKDVIEALGIKNTSMAIRKLQKQEKDITSIDTLGGAQEMTIVNESGMYALIFQSRKKEAQTFRYWVTNEVLPSLRKTGSFSLKEVDPLDQLKMHVAIMEKQREEIRNMNSRLEAVAIESKQDNDTLTHDQITQLDKAIADKHKQTGIKDYKVLGLIRKSIKNEFFEISGSRTYKEIPRRGFEKALSIVSTFKVPDYLKELQ